MEENSKEVTLYDAGISVVNGEQEFYNKRLIVCDVRYDGEETYYEMTLHMVLGTTDDDGNRIPMLMKIKYLSGENSDKYFWLPIEDMKLMQIICSIDDDNTEDSYELYNATERPIYS